MTDAIGNRVRLAPGFIPIPLDMPRPLLAYGRYWFLDVWKETHTAGFVLVIENDDTHGHIPPTIHIPHAYTDWT